MSGPGVRATRRARRGVEAIEFAMILPLFIAIMFGIVEYSWYMFQRSGVVDAARVACRTAAQLDPAFDDVVTVGAAVVLAELSEVGVDCTGGGACVVEIDDRSGEFPPRVICDVTAAYRPLTGFLATAGGGEGSVGNIDRGAYDWRGVGLLPETMRGRAVAVYEGE